MEANKTLNDSEAFFLKYKKAILTVVAALVIIVAGAILYKNYVAIPQEQEASTAIAKGQEYMNMEEYEKALKGDSIGYAGFLKIADDYSGTDAGNLAKLYAGLCYAHMQKPDWKSALKYVEGFSTADDQLISPASQMALGDIYANNEQPEKAVECFKKAAKMADSKADKGLNTSISPLALKKAGIMLESLGKKEEALKIYNGIKEKYVNTPIYQDIDKYIERVSNP